MFQNTTTRQQHAGILLLQRTQLLFNPALFQQHLHPQKFALISLAPSKSWATACELSDLNSNQKLELLVWETYSSFPAYEVEEETLGGGWDTCEWGQSFRTIKILTFRDFPGGLGRRQWQPTPVFLPGKSHGPRSLMGYSPWGHEDSDATE